MSNNMKQKGFTLVEVIMYIGILALIITALASFGFSVMSSNSKTMTVTEVQGNARMALDVIAQKIRASNGINIGNSVFGSDPGTLELSMSDVSKNPTLFNLDANDGRLQIKEGVSSPVFLTSDKVRVTNLVFTNYSQVGEREHVRVTMTVEYKNAGSVDYSYSYDVWISVSLRQ
jgi:Tfp pilus assembly protein PilW